VINTERLPSIGGDGALLGIPLPDCLANAFEVLTHPLLGPSLIPGAEGVEDTQMLGVVFLARPVDVENGALLALKQLGEHLE